MSLCLHEVDFTPPVTAVRPAVDSAPGPDPPRPKRTRYVDDEPWCTAYSPGRKQNEVTVSEQGNLIGKSYSVSTDPPIF
mgnify:CR=1 FL=1